ncbi:hypothetical protein CWI38_0015p0110 [Hamiltosporidium tvaerminnensis]|uniref:Uncharacterized protein n=1 Tax=Hamiltosporidium tvaerminnensis TaxID=1176355 RepID=A0A4V2JYF7_9MICR|nr:hypothetical protein CWI38_0015p0110 [Hamiltosporidium tvaerminnensis]
MIIFIFGFIFASQKTTSYTREEKHMNATENSFPLQYVGNVANRMNSESKRKIDNIGDTNKFFSKKNKISDDHNIFTQTEYQTEILKMVSSRDLTMPDRRFKLSKFKIYSYYENKYSRNIIATSFDKSCKKTTYLEKDKHDVSDRHTDTFQGNPMPSCSYEISVSPQRKKNDVKLKPKERNLKRFNLKTLGADSEILIKNQFQNKKLAAVEHMSKSNSNKSLVMRSLRILVSKLKNISEDENVLGLLEVISPHLEGENTELVQNIFKDKEKPGEDSNLETDTFSSFETRLNEKIEKIRSAEDISDKELYILLEFSNHIVEYEKNSARESPSTNKNEILSRFKFDDLLDIFYNKEEYLILSEFAFFLNYHDKKKIEIRQNHVLYVRFIFSLLKKYINQIIKLRNNIKHHDHNLTKYIFRCRCIIFMLLHGLEGFVIRKYLYFAMSNLIFQNEICYRKKFFSNYLVFSFHLNIILHTSFSNISIFKSKVISKIYDLFSLFANSEDGSNTLNQNKLFREFTHKYMGIDTIRNTIEVYEYYKTKSFLLKKFKFYKYMESLIYPKYANNDSNMTDLNNDILLDIFRVNLLVEKLHTRIIFHHLNFKEQTYNRSFEELIRKIEQYIQ